MSAPPTSLRVTLLQTSAGTDIEANFRAIERMLPAAGGADIIVLPEVFALRGSHTDYRRHAEPLEGTILRRVASWAAERKVWMLAGSIIERAGRRFHNTSVLFDRRGRRKAVYRKIHLFEAHLENGIVVRERDTYSPGRTPVMASIEGWRCGLAICYDLRFPELFRRYAARGSHILFLPSNFTQRTGRDHWETLIRARAIENQCFVVAPNQCGVNPVTGVASYGHSMVVGPWGETLVALGARVAAASVTLDSARLDETRRRIPALRHRRL